jgi:glycine hydroxymethyltransferase
MFEEIPLLKRFTVLVNTHEAKMSDSFSLVPSENTLSPVAKLLLLSDAYSRYFFDDDRLSGNWAFHGGKYIGEIQNEIVMPSLKRLTKANHVNVKPVSGLSNMIVSFSAYCPVGSKVLTVPHELGGHASTQTVAERLGLSVSFLPQKGQFDINGEKLIALLKQELISLIYIDQASSLFPLDIAHLRKCVTESGAQTHIHVDTSHINGLIFGGVLPNPLECGADSFGGSFHKSFPGPHKAFFATNDYDIYEAANLSAAHLVSHHHGAEILALAVSLIEFELCGGTEYAQNIVKNAKAFAKVLDNAGFNVGGSKHGYTTTHQVWIGNNAKLEGNNVVSDHLYKSGILVNAFGSLPIFPQGGIRVGLNEATKYGLLERDTEELAELFVEAALSTNLDQTRQKVVDLRRAFPKPKYCFPLHEFTIRDTLIEACHTK